MNRSCLIKKFYVRESGGRSADDVVEVVKGGLWRGDAPMVRILVQVSGKAPRRSQVLKVAFQSGMRVAEPCYQFRSQSAAPLGHRRSGCGCLVSTFPIPPAASDKSGVRAIVKQMHDWIVM